MRIAIFGDCIPLGFCSFYVLDKRLVGKSNLLLKDRPVISLIDELKKFYDIDNFCKKNVAVSYKGCFEIPHTESIVYQIMKMDLSSYDAIIIFGCIHDYRHTNITKARKNSTNPNSVHGAYNLVISTLKEKYPDKKVIFSLPLWSKTKNNVS